MYPLRKVLTHIPPRFFPENVVCSLCQLLKHVFKRTSDQMLLDSIMEANTMNPEQTDLKGSSLIWVHIIFPYRLPKNISRREQTTKNVTGGIQKKLAKFYECYYITERLLNVMLTFKAPIATKGVCFSRLLKCLRSLYDKQCGPKSDCS